MKSSGCGWPGSMRRRGRGVPVELAMKANLIGTPEMVAERLRVYRDAGVTTLRLGLAGAGMRDKLETLGRVMELSVSY